MADDRLTGNSLGLDFMTRREDLLLLYLFIYFAFSSSVVQLSACSLTEGPRSHVYIFLTPDWLCCVDSFGVAEFLLAHLLLLANDSCDH